MLLKLPQLDVTRLAADFSAAVRASHSDIELHNIRARNADETDSNVDHVHDYTDANDLMAAAVSLQIPDWNWNDIAQDIAMAWQRAKQSEYRLSRILVACEYSGTVRDEFAARGHSVMSCDILPTESPGAHYQGDVRDIINDGWHMMVAHPPCTYLAACQLWRCQEKHDKQYPARQLKSDKALQFVRDLMSAPIDKWALENPKGRIGSTLRKADQVIQPYQFGHDVSKETHLWLNGLAPLEHGEYVQPRNAVNNAGNPVKRWGNQCDGSGADRRGPSADRGHKRSKFFSGIASAMAEQWGGICARIKPPTNKAPRQLALI